MIDSILNIIEPAQLAFPEPVEASIIAPYLFVSAAMFAIGTTRSARGSSSSASSTPTPSRSPTPWSPTAW